MTIPNLITCFRFVLIPGFVLLFLQARQPQEYLLSAAVLLLSGVTDMLDGFIARKFHMTSKLGKVLDPAADKLTLLAVMCVLWIKYPQYWLLYALFLGKEVVMAAAGLFLLHRNRDLEGAKWFGKLYTILFYLVSVLMFADSRQQAGYRAVLLGGLAVFTVFCFTMYIPVFLQQLEAEKAAVQKSADTMAN